MSAETLRRAAALMRERANSASDGPWTTGEYAMSVMSNGSNILNGCCDGDGYTDHADAEHIASWHPAVALAVADWLDDEAGKSEWFKRGKPVYPESPLARAVATTYLGEAS